jgi:CDP-glucose 4,6-dehydratase
VAKPQPEFWVGKRVFVTGASGFLGTWTVKELNCRGATTIGYVRDGGHHLSRRDDPATEPHLTVHGQLEDYETVLRAINEHEADSVLHLGAQPIVGVANRNPRSTFEANVRGTWNVLDACRELGRQVERIIVASSDKAYGVAAALPYDETMPLNANHPYDASKACTDILARTYFHSYGLPVCVTRAGNFFGGRDMNFNRIVPGVARWALRGERPVLRSDGSMVRDYIYVRDVVLGYLALAERMEDPALHGHAFNFSTEQPITTITLVRRILAAAGREDLQPIILGQATNEIPEQHLSAAKARTFLDWEPVWTMDKALDETLAWYRAWLEAGAGRFAQGEAQRL